MSKKKQAAATPTAEKAMAVIAYGDAVALGEDTLTSIVTNITIKDNGKVTKAKGMIETIAVAESSTGDVFAFAANDVTAVNADIIILKTKNKSFEGSDGLYVSSVTKFKAIDSKAEFEEPIIITKTKNRNIENNDIDIDLDGNISVVEFDVHAYGENSLAIVDTYSLSMEDELSLATILATAATG